MRAICTGDLHFGAGTKFSDDRLAEQKQVWRMTLDLARQYHCPVIVAGDVFHRPRPTPAEQQAFFWPVGEMGVEVWVCPGNHDWLAVNQPTELAVWRGQIPNLHVIDEPCVTMVDGDEVAWLPWTPPHLLQSANPGESRDDLNVRIAGMLVAVAQMLRHDGAQVLVAHWSVSSAQLPHGGLVQEFLREPILSSHELAEIGFDAVVLGHIHKQQVITGLGPITGVGPASFRRPVFYVGSPMPLDFGEGGYPHGVTLLDTHGAEEVVLTNIGIESRPFVTLDYREHLDAAASMAWCAGLDGPSMTDVPEGAIVRLRYRATREEQAKIDTAALVRGFEAAGASRVYVLPEITKGVRSRVQVEDDLGPIETLATWAGANRVGVDATVALIDLTNELLGEAGAA